MRIDLSHHRRDPGRLRRKRGLEFEEVWLTKVPSSSGDPVLSAKPGRKRGSVWADHSRGTADWKHSTGGGGKSSLESGRMWEALGCWQRVGYLAGDGASRYEAGKSPVSLPACSTHSQLPRFGNLWNTLLLTEIPGVR